MADPLLESYEAIPYDVSSFPKSHPDNLCVVAEIFGVSPAKPEQARVLELGCAGGGNLLPMASALPNSEFLGVDFASTHIARAEEVCKAVGLSNISFRQADILDLSDDLGTFDYIIAHGVFSWVSREVQERIFALCEQLLRPQGLAYMSYNTYPGWRLREVSRKMLLYHLRGVSDPLERNKEARTFLQNAARAVQDVDSPHALILQAEAAKAVRSTEASLAHDLLERENNPVYFSEFVERAMSHGLQYVGDAVFEQMILSNLGEHAREIVDQASDDIVSSEQYTDFVLGRGFRRSILCCEDVALKRKLNASLMRPFFFSARLKAKRAGDNKSRTFTAQDGTTVTVKSPAVESVLLALARLWPRRLSWAEVLEEVSKHLSRADDSGDCVEELDQEIDQALFEGFKQGIITVSARANGAGCEVSDKPEITPYARFQAEHQESVSNLNHVSLSPRPFVCALMTLLDGTRGRGEIIDLLSRHLSQNRIPLDDQGRILESPREQREVLEQAVDRALRELVVNAYLLA